MPGSQRQSVSNLNATAIQELEELLKTEPKLLLDWRDAMFTLIANGIPDDIEPLRKLINLQDSTGGEHDAT